MATTFIGGGNMASALIGGMLARGRAAAELRIVEPLPAQRARLALRFPGVGLFADCGGDAFAGSTLIVFAVKPQQMREAALAVAPRLVAADALVMTIAAGIRLVDLARWLGGYSRLVRAMPNTPALVGAGISGVYAAPDVDAAGRAVAAAVLEAGGEVLWVADEAMLDAVTGVSGSGPAYVLYFIEALEQAARDLGFGGAEARRLAYATFGGAVALARAGGDDPATLRAQVTSKGGTTERALALLEADAVKAKIVVAVKAAAAKAVELGDAFGRDA
jgi:pyrroline-5-carboxylate reductase